MLHDKIFSASCFPFWRHSIRHLDISMKLTKKRMLVWGLPIAGIIIVLVTCGLIIFRSPSPHQQMISLLQELNAHNSDKDNPFNPDVKIKYCDSLAKRPGNSENFNLLHAQAQMALKAGREQQSVDIYEKLMQRADVMTYESLLREEGIAYMRLGERTNCMLNHNRSSCIFPIKDAGV